MISTLVLLTALSAPVETDHVRVTQLSSISFECICRSDEASPDFDCSATCKVATETYTANHQSPPAESCDVSPDNCVEVSKIEVK